MICFAWDGFPQYAARCIREFVRGTDESVFVVATKPTVPMKGMDAVCGCRVVWIEKSEQRTLCKMLGAIPRCIFIGGWGLNAQFLSIILPCSSNII